jgi:hypothetical protein
MIVFGTSSISCIYSTPRAIPQMVSTQISMLNSSQDTKAVVLVKNLLLFTRFFDQLYANVISLLIVVS